MESNGKVVLMCSCEGTIPLDAKSLAKTLGGKEPFIHSQLCRSQIENYKTAIAANAQVLVACAQEVPLFEEVREESGSGTHVRYVNLREVAGWGNDGKKATAKMAALIAEASLDIPATTTVSLSSQGSVLVIGRDQAALNEAKQLASRMDVTFLLQPAGDVIPPAQADFPVFSGKVCSASGHLGAFEVEIDGFSTASPSSRKKLAFDISRKRYALRCDLILDLTGNTLPIDKRDGYFAPAPRDPVAVLKAMFEITDMVGEFEKPRYASVEAKLCAYARNAHKGCGMCIDVCTASAIQPAGDAVSIDPFVCAGCGDCAGVCPTGAVTYTLPVPEALLNRLRVLLLSYRKAGGKKPVLLVHDSGLGSEMVGMMGRFGRGLPANVLPFAINRVTQLGLDFLAATQAYGATAVHILAPRSHYPEIAGLSSQVKRAGEILDGLGLAGERITVLDDEDPLAVEELLWKPAGPKPVKPAEFMLLGGKQERVWKIMRHLHAKSPKAKTALFPLSPGAPFGTIEVEDQACTLCLSCVGACPTGALGSNRDRPMLRFLEDKCIQCGLCIKTCPEKAVGLSARLNFGDDAGRFRVIKEDDPFLCEECGTPFAAKKAVERIIERVTHHSAFADPARLRHLRLCESCRVFAEADWETEHGAGPLAVEPRPMVRTTDDYLRERDVPKRKH